MKIYESLEGVLSEDIPFEIHTEYKVRLNEKQVCKHCHSLSIIKLSDIDDFFENEYICTKVIIMYNEGGYNRTIICLDCLIEKHNQNFK